jgi:ferrochelatase
LSRPFDAVLVIGFGGPQGPADVRPFLANVLRGRRVPPERVELVVHHYDLFGGVSPVTELTMRQAEGLAERLQTGGPDVPVFVGMRNWHPYLADTLERMADQGVRRAIGLVTAAQRNDSSCLQYKENVRDARAELRRRGKPDVDVVFTSDWHLHAGFIGANVQHVMAAVAALPAGLRTRARLVFTAHSIPLDMARRSPYERQLREGAALVAARAGFDDWTLVFQSRSGRPEDPWLEPDISDYLRAEGPKGLQAVVLCPIGFVCDHIEVLYDLDVEAAAAARQTGIALARARTAGANPVFLDGLAEVVRETWARYAGGVPLPVVPAQGPAEAGPGRK